MGHHSTVPEAVCSPMVFEGIVCSSVVSRLSLRGLLPALHQALVCHIVGGYERVLCEGGEMNEERSEEFGGSRRVVGSNWNIDERKA